jgi:hypothetical protein
LVAIAILLVLCSGFLHALWNLYAKKSSNTYVFLWLFQKVANKLIEDNVLNNFEHRYSRYSEGIGFELSKEKQTSIN